jgi:hypothetical protein
MWQSAVHRMQQLVLQAVHTWATQHVAADMDGVAAYLPVLYRVAVQMIVTYIHCINFSPSVAYQSQRLCSMRVLAWAADMLCSTRTGL